MRCYICGHSIEPDSPDERYNKYWKEKIDGKIVPVCHKCKMEMLEAQINDRYKAMGRRAMMKHNKDRKEIGLF